MLKSITIGLLFLLGLTINISAQKNSAPVISVPGEQRVRTGQPLDFTVTGRDANTGQILDFKATGLPSGSKFIQTSPTAAQFNWTPKGTQTGTFKISVRVVDNGSPALSSPTRDINIIVENRTPVLRVPDSQKVAKGQPLKFTVSGSDEDLGQVLKFSATGLPSLASFEKISATEARFEWIPTADQNGPYSATIRVEDNGSPSRADTKKISISIKSNGSPVLTVPGAQAGTPGQPLSFVVSADDPDDGQILRLTATGLPTGAVFRQQGASKGKFEWTPSGEQTGSYAVKVTVEDRGTPALSDTKSIRIVVQNRPPEISVPETQTVLTGNLLKYVVRAADVDPGQSLRIDTSGLPSGATLREISSSRIEFSWTPKTTQTGTFQVNYKVTDNGSPNLSQSKSVKIQVLRVENWEKLESFNSNVTELRDLEIWQGSLVAGTDAGVYVFWLNGWREINEGLSNLKVNSLAVRDSVLYAATDSGMFYVNYSPLAPIPGYGLEWKRYGNSSDEPNNSPVKILASSGANLLAATNEKVLFSSGANATWKPIYYGSVRILAFSNTGETVYLSQQPDLCRAPIRELQLGTFRPEDNNKFFPGCTSLGPLYPPVVEAFAASGAKLIAETCGTLSGPVLSTNNGESWVQGIRPSSCTYSFTNLGSDLLFAGTADGVFLSTNFGQSWVQQYRSSNDIRSFTSSEGVLYAGSQKGEVFRVKITGSY